MRSYRHALVWLSLAVGSATLTPAIAHAVSEPSSCDPPRLSVGAEVPVVTLDLYFDPTSPGASIIPRAARALVASRAQWLSVRLNPVPRPLDRDAPRMLLTEALVSLASNGHAESALQWAAGRPTALLVQHLEDPSRREALARTLGVEVAVITPGGASMRCARRRINAGLQRLQVELLGQPAEITGAARLLPVAIIGSEDGVVTAATVDMELTRLGEHLDRVRRRLRERRVRPRDAPQSGAGTKDAARVSAARSSLYFTNPFARHHMEVTLTGERSKQGIERLRFALGIRARALGVVDLTIDAWGSTPEANLLRRRACQAAASERVLAYVRYLATPTIERGAPRLRALIDDLDAPPSEGVACVTLPAGVQPPPGLRINGIIIPPGDMEAAHDALRRPLAVDYLVALP